MMVKVKINRETWKQYTLVFPGIRPIKRPMFRDVMEYSPQIAKLLIEKGYATPVEENDGKPTVPSVMPPVSKKVEVLPPPPKEEVKEVVTTPESSDSLPEESLSTEKTLEEKIVELFSAYETAFIVDNVRWVGTETVEKIKKQEPLSYTVIRTLLSDRQFNSLKEYIESENES